ncbi:MAG: hypothetical protein KDC34_02340 [Saprospiraceae bacterium]|nr:hypothetical protein [Saprospiraceae bacterium]
MSIKEQLPVSGTFFVQAILLLTGTVWLGYFIEQSDFGQILPAFALLFVSYFWILRTANPQIPWKQYLYLAVLLRVVLLFAMPGLSDDLYRFVWDGRLLSQGINPFDHLPAYYLQQGQEVAGLDQSLFDALNSPEYYTIYPPVAQAIFGLACLLFPKSIFGSMLVMKVFLIGCEILSIYLLPRILTLLKLPVERSLIYCLNPLILIEISGNLHFEGAMIAFFLVGIYLLLVGRDQFAGMGMALSIASKLLTLIFMPFYIRRLGWKRVIPFFLAAAVLCFLLFLPMINGVFLNHFGESLDLYFRKFEFNASVYYLFRWIGFQITGYNYIAVIGPALALISSIGILVFAFFHPGHNWKGDLKYMLFGICLYLALSTTVHPWYLSLPIILCCFTSYRFPIIWSALITLTYINYSYQPYQENLQIVAVEYISVGLFFLWEVSRHSDLRLLYRKKFVE